MTDVTTIIQALAVIGACWAVISGVGAWKREFIGKRKIALAEETLATFFEIKDAIAFIRNPFSRGDEGKSRKRADFEAEEESELLDRGYIVFERYNLKKDTFVRFNTLKYRFMAVFGTETDKVFKDMDGIMRSIFTAANMLATHYWQRQGRVKMEEEEFRKNLEEMHRLEEIFWDHFNENDEIRSKLNSTQLDLERATKSCFEEPMKTYEILTKNGPARVKRANALGDPIPRGFSNGTIEIWDEFPKDL